MLSSIKNKVGIISLAFLLIIVCSEKLTSRNIQKHMMSINSSASEDRPIVTLDGSKMFFGSTKRAGHDSLSYFYDYYEKCYRWDYNIYMSEKVGDKWSEPVFINAVNTGSDDGILSISPDGKTIYFLSFKTGCTDDGGPFYKAEFDGSKWTNIQGLGGGITDFLNFKKYNIWNLYEGPSGTFLGLFVFGGSISSDGNEFYFSTDVSTKYGKLDIWVSRLKNGIWSYPENLGPEVNIKSAMNVEPQISYDGKILYYSSNGNSIKGDCDIGYSSKNSDGKWTKPITLGPEINTNLDDMQITIPVNGNSIFLSALDIYNNGLRNIYEFKISEDQRILPNFTIVRGKIIDRKTGKPIEADIQVKNTTFDLISYKTKSNPTTGKYSITIQNGMDYEILIDNVNYNNYITVYKPRENFGEIIEDIKLSRVEVDENDVTETDDMRINKNKIKIFPNPANDKLNIVFDEIKDLSEMILTISDMSGNEVFKENITGNSNSTNLNISFLGSGVYFVNITDKKGFVVSSKFIKN